MAEHAWDGKNRTKPSKACMYRRAVKDWSNTQSSVWLVSGLQYCSVLRVEVLTSCPEILGAKCSDSFVCPSWKWGDSLLFCAHVCLERVWGKKWLWVCVHLCGQPHYHCRHQQKWHLFVAHGRIQGRKNLWEDRKAPSWCNGNVVLERARGSF